MTVAFHTLGCKTNAYETQAMLEQFREAGFTAGDFTQNCDVYVINTCAVTAEAARKSRQIAGRCKKINPDAVVVVTGCYAQEAGRELAEKTGADIIVGNGNKNAVVSLVRDRLNSRECMSADDPSRNICLQEPLAVIDDQTHMRTYEEQSVTGQEDHIRAYVKIQDGCDRFCSYCIIPFLRGRSRSRDLQNIIKEVHSLAEAGFPEVVLTGIDISSFKIAEDPDSADSLAQLVSEISKEEGIRRIRFGSLEAGVITDYLVSSLKENTKFCPQFHLSLQSGCNSVLKRMNRHYSTEEFAGSVNMIRKYFPDAAITTDIIAGFAGESEEEFEQTIKFVKDTRFSRLHVFPYSRREGTRADKMPGQLSRAEKEFRTKKLIGLGRELQKEYEQRFIGKNCRMLVEEAELVPLREHAGTIASEYLLQLEGYTPEYVRIRAACHVREYYGQNYIGQIVDIVPAEYDEENGILTGTFSTE